MAVFEKKIVRKVFLDDTQILSCLFENTQNIQGHTEYIIRVQRGPLPEKYWYIYKRYNDFVQLHSQIQISGLNMQFPPKKLLGNMEREFIVERQCALQNYLNSILMNPILASSLALRKFLDPDNYSTPFHEVALQQVSMALRSEVNYEVVKPLSDIGWRIRKHYFLVKNANSPKEEKILSWVEYGPDKYLENRDLQGVFKSLASLQHHLIEPIEFISCNEVGAFIIRNLNTEGSLRDLICSSKPKLQFMKKYANPKEYRSLSTGDIASFGYQILEQLKFLNDKGLSFGHLHAGNIIISNRRARLVDIENGVLGVPSLYRPYFIQHRAVQSCDVIDVYCFGHVLFEMVFGHPLNEPVCDSFPASCPTLLRSILESILSSESCKSGLPRINDLMSNPFFSGCSNASAAERPHLRISSQQKEALKLSRQKMEARLKEEQKVVRHQKRIVKVEALLNSEGEQRKRKIRQHKQLREQQQQQQLVANGKSPERSDSPNSTSTATSAGTLTPPSQSQSGSNGLSPAPPPPPAPWDTSPSAAPVRSALLGSICNFDKAALRRATP